MATTETTSLKSGKSKLYLRALDRKIYSTDSDAFKRHSFSVQQRIKSFENLASFERPAVKGNDIQSYAVGSKAAINKRLYALAQSNDNRCLKRSLSSCVEILNLGHSSSLQSQNSSSNTLINNSKSPPLAGTSAPVTEERATPEVTVPQSCTVPHTPPVLRSRNTRANCGISRSKLRELRALSMPELDKLSSQDFSKDPANVVFKTELEIQPTRATKPPSDNLQCTVVTRMSMVEPGSIGNGEHAQELTVKQSSWSVSLKDLSSSRVEQKKVQNVLNSLPGVLDVMTLIKEVNNVLEVKENVHFVILTKNMGSGLGFSIAGGVDLEQKSITVHRVFTQGAAGLEGTIRRGDVVLSINGISLSGRTHGEALSCLHQTKLAKQALVVIHRGSDSAPVTVRQDLLLKSRTYSSSAFPDISRENEAAVEVGPDGALKVDLLKTSAGVGFSLEGGKASAHGDRPLYIKRIFKGGAAELSQVIDVGDELLAVNGRSLQGLMHYDAWNIIKTASEGTIQRGRRRGGGRRGEKNTERCCYLRKEEKSPERKGHIAGGFWSLKGMCSRQERIQKDVDIVIKRCQAEKDCLFSDFRFTDATFTFTYSKGSKSVSYSVHVSDDYPDNTYVSNSENNDDVLVTRDPIPVIFHRIATEIKTATDDSCLSIKSKLQIDKNTVNYDGELHKHPQLEADLVAVRELYGHHAVSLRIMQTFVTQQWKHHTKDKLNCPHSKKQTDKKVKSPLHIFSTLRSGSHIENWHSILRNGLVVASKTKLQLHGAIYGSGIYLSPLSSISFGYSGINKKQQKIASKDDTATNKTNIHLQSQKKGQQPQFLQSRNLKCIALCEVITSPDLHKHGDIWVVPNTDHVCTRFFFVYEDGQVGDTSINTQEPSINREILRVIGNQTATG
ncbi:PDZ domain-containing protein 2 [Bagarius yarrelli]|uniref:Poly [ADP-ribose] polymerase n=1 Tax=Bagarius yarrelli TaxID=175774 RepID=A0A556U821_BAGYA|nr:PDZ domain-containing protein 2 [Bagarius yarrelli]